MLSVAAAVGGCAAPASFEDPDPASRLAALGEAVEAGDRSSIPDIITLLDSDDMAVRLFAILALEDLTGQTLGYDYAASPSDRRDAADRWEAWYRESARGSAEPQPGSGPGDRAAGEAGEQSVSP
jgi:hypothetical protein